MNHDVRLRSYHGRTADTVTPNRNSLHFFICFSFLRPYDLLALAILTNWAMVSAVLKTVLQCLSEFILNKTQIHQDIKLLRMHSVHKKESVRSLWKFHFQHSRFRFQQDWKKISWLVGFGKNSRVLFLLTYYLKYIHQWSLFRFQLLKIFKKSTQIILFILYGQ